MPDRDDALVRTADIEVRPAASATDLAQATAMLDTQELVLGVPLVDEAERERLEAAGSAPSGEAPADGVWRPVVARRGDEVVGYAAIMTPDAPEEVAVGDLAPARLPGAWAGILPTLLAALEAVVATDAAALQVWVRHIDIGDLAPAVAAGYRVERRLAVLGRNLDIEQPIAPPEGMTVRPYRPDVDDESVVAVLASAYADTEESGWDLARFRRRRAMSWFRAEDLLVAVDTDGRIVGLHWLKRRDAFTGEVYNLAIHRDAQGRGLGPVLLEAGLAHLRSVGCSEVILWVDRANARAVSLYTSRGFTTRWDDVALHHTLPHGDERA